MRRTGENTFEMNEDEQLVESFMSYLMEERGRTFEQAEAYLMRLPDTVAAVLSGSLVTYIKTGDLPPLEPAAGNGA